MIDMEGLAEALRTVLRGSTDLHTTPLEDALITLVEFHHAVLMNRATVVQGIYTLYDEDGSTILFQREIGLTR